MDVPPTLSDVATEPLLSEEDAAPEDDGASSRLCGLKKRAAYVVIGLTTALLITGIVLAVIYGRPPDWKVAGSLDAPAGELEPSLAVSGDGTVLALMLRNERGRRFGDAGDFVVQLAFTGPRQLNGDVRNGGLTNDGQTFDPFTESSNGKYPLPVNSGWDDEFDPQSIWGDFSLSDNADTLVVLGNAALWDYWSSTKKQYHGLCNVDGKGNVTSRWRYEYNECYYGRVSTFERNGDGYWNPDPVGQPIESFTAREALKPSSRRAEVVALSGNGKNLAIGYGGFADVYERDDSTDTKWKKVGESIQDGNADFGRSVSLNEDGTRVAIGGFGTDKVAVYARRDDSWEVLGSDIEGSGPGDFGLTVSLSGAGDRVAVVARDRLSETKYDQGLPYGETDAARVQVFEFDGDSEWEKLGNDITGFAACCSDSGAGSGARISGDGSTIVVGAGLDNDHVQPYRFDGKQSWKPLGSKLAGVNNWWLTAVTSDGNQAATLDYASEWSKGESHMKLYTIKRGL